MLTKTQDYKGAIQQIHKCVEWLEKVGGFGKLVTELRTAHDKLRDRIEKEDS